MTKKMTRREALTSAIEIVSEFLRDNFDMDDMDATHTQEVIDILENMVTQIDKQAARPKSKTSARIQNETMTKEFIKKLAEVNEPVNAKWMTYNVKYCLTTQKAVAIAAIAEEWNAIEKVTIKNRTYYQLVPDYVPND